MKKIIIAIISFFLVSLGISINTQASTKDNYYVSIKEEVFFENTNVINIIDDDIYQTNNEFNIKDINRKGRLINYFVSNEYYYLIYECNFIYYIELLDNNLEQKNKVSIDYKITNSILTEQNLYLVGTRNNNATLAIYDLNLNYISLYEYGGSGYEEYTNIYEINNTLYLFGIKDGISHNSCFANSGNSDDKKSFIITLDEQYKIKKSFYMNKNDAKEEIINIYIKDNLIYYLLKTSKNDYYQYIISLDLNILASYKINEYIISNKIHLVDSINMASEIVYLYIKEDDLYIGIFDNKLKYEYKICKDMLNKDLLYFNNKEGTVNIYYKQQNDIYKLSLIEYHIIFNNTKEVYYKDKTYLDTDHFLVESYFTNLTFLYDKDLNKDINLNKSNMYEAYYKAKVGYEEIKIKTKYNVKSYLNVVNNGIYERGYVLNFTDTLYINNQKVYPGEVLNQTGEVSVRHETMNEVKEYSIYVTNKYYKDFKLNEEKCDIELYEGSIYKYQIQVQNYQDIDCIYVNNKEYPYKQENNKIVLEFASDVSNIIKEYNVNYILFKDGTILEINDIFKIKTLKNLPIIDIYYIDDNITYNILDPDKSVNDIVIKYYKNNELIKEEKTFLRNTEIFTNDDNIKIQVVLQYENGSEEFYETLLFEIDVSTLLKEEKILDIETVFDEENLSLIKIKVNDSLRIKVLSSNVQNLSLTSYYNNDKAIKIIFITTISTGIILAISGVILLIKKKKTKGTNN